MSFIRPLKRTVFQPSETSEDFFLAVSRLVPYKRIDLAVEACNNLNLPLVVIGSGREEKRLRAMAGPTVKILGWQPDEEVARYLSLARGLIFPGEEDFGILPVEAQAAGTPIIAYGRGGALETVKNGETGCFFEAQTAESLMAALKRFERVTFSRRAIASHARDFDELVFRKRISEFVQKCYAEFQEDDHVHLPPLDFAPLPHDEADLEEHALVQNGGDKNNWLQTVGKYAVDSPLNRMLEVGAELRKAERGEEC